MTVSFASAALLCLATWMSMAGATNGPVADCCTGWSNTRINNTLIVKYTIQSESVCKLRAVMFHTKGDKKICSNPDNLWAKKAMKEVDKRKALQDIIDRSTSCITPAASTTVTKKPQATTIHEVDEENDKETLQNDGDGDDKSTTSIAPATSTTTATTKPQATTIHKVDETEERSTRDMTPAVSTTATEEPQATTICDMDEGTDKEALQDKGHGDDKSTTSITPATSTTTTTTTTIRKVDEENKQKEYQIMEQTGERSARDMTPAVSTISKKAPRRKCRHGRRRQGRRKGKKKMRRRI